MVRTADRNLRGTAKIGVTLALQVCLETPLPALQHIRQVQKGILEQANQEQRVFRSVLQATWHAEVGNVSAKIPLVHWQERYF